MCRCQGHLQRISCYNKQLIDQVSRMQCFSGYFLKNHIIFITIVICITCICSTAFCQPETKGSVIVIDPGHGGSDIGATGADNTFEKKISLKAANKIKEALEKNYSVVLTRTGDYGVNTKKRTEIANNMKAKLFLSIHTGASYARETKGLSFIYFKALPFKNKKDISIDNVRKTEWDSVQEKHVPLSRVFAESLYGRFSKTISYGKPRIESLPISVLSGANMPAIMIEIGHLTNPSEEQRLNNSDFLSDYMKEIAYEIELFLKKYKNSY